MAGALGNYVWFAVRIWYTLRAGMSHFPIWLEYLILPVLALIALPSVLREARRQIRIRSAGGVQGKRKQAMARPIFVIGKARSGTKWLSNIIGGNSEVACVQGEDFTGILETNLFFLLPQAFGDLRRDENYCAMAACYAKTSFFRITGLDEKILFERKVEDYHAFFRQVMDSYAEKEGKPNWLQKTDPMVLPALHEAFPDAQFVVIRRGILANLRSSTTLAKKLDVKENSIFSEMAMHAYGEKIYDLYRGKPNVTFVKFEDLLGDRQGVTRGVCEFLGLEFQEAMLSPSYRKNTSFGDKASRARALSAGQEWTIALLGKLFRVLPMWFLKISRERFGHNRNPSRSRFVPGTFLSLRQEYGWDRKDN